MIVSILAKKGNLSEGYSSYIRRAVLGIPVASLHDGTIMGHWNLRDCLHSAVVNRLWADGGYEFPFDLVGAVGTDYTVDERKWLTGHELCLQLALVSPSFRAIVPRDFSLYFNFVSMICGIKESLLLNVNGSPPWRIWSPDESYVLGGARASSWQKHLLGHSIYRTTMYSADSGIYRLVCPINHDWSMAMIVCAGKADLKVRYDSIIMDSGICHPLTCDLSIRNDETQVMWDYATATPQLLQQFCGVIETNLLGLEYGVSPSTVMRVIVDVSTYWLVTWWGSGQSVS